MDRKCPGKYPYRANVLSSSYAFSIHLVTSNQVLSFVDQSVSYSQFSQHWLLPIMILNLTVFLILFLRLQILENRNNFVVMKLVWIETVIGGYRWIFKNNFCINSLLAYSINIRCVAAHVLHEKQNDITDTMCCQLLLYVCVSGCGACTARNRRRRYGRIQGTSL